VRRLRIPEKPGFVVNGNEPVNPPPSFIRVSLPAPPVYLTAPQPRSVQEPSSFIMIDEPRPRTCSWRSRVEYLFRASTGGHRGHREFRIPAPQTLGLGITRTRPQLGCLDDAFRGPSRSICYPSEISPHPCSRGAGCTFPRKNLPSASD
jgi:hypothetical protein